MSYYYHYIFLPKEDDFEERLAEQLEYEKRQQLHGHKGESPERLVRNEETMPF